MNLKKGGEIPSNIIDAVNNSNSLMEVGTNLDEMGVEYEFNTYDTPMPPVMYKIKFGDKHIYILNKNYVDGADYVKDEIGVGIMAKGGKINTFNSEKDYENYLRKEGKPFDSVVIGKEEFTQDFYDSSGNQITYRSKYGNQLEIENGNRYENGFGDSNVYINEGMYPPYDEEGNFAKGGEILDDEDFIGFLNNFATDNYEGSDDWIIGGKDRSDEYEAYEWGLALYDNDQKRFQRDKAEFAKNASPDEIKSIKDREYEYEEEYAKGGKISDLIVGNKVGHLRPHTGRYEYSEITEINGNEVKLVHRHPTKRYWDNYFEMGKDQIEEFIDTPSKDFKDGRPLMKIKKSYAKGGYVVKTYEDENDLDGDFENAYDTEEEAIEEARKLKKKYYMVEVDDIDNRGTIFYINKDGYEEFFAKGGEIVEVRYRGMPISESMLGKPVMSEETTDILEDEFRQDLTFTPIEETNMKPLSYENSRKFILDFDKNFKGLLKGYAKGGEVCSGCGQQECEC
jgi:hypothetical protein